MKIVKIEKSNEKCHTYDIEVPEAHNYLIEGGLVSHNSSLTSNSTNGIEPVRALVSYKKSKVGVTKQIIPLVKYSKYYTLAWNIKSNQTMNNVAAVIQKFFDMSISTNHYYNPSNYPDSNVPLSVIIKDILHANKVGLKTLYYANTNDGSDETSGCESGACAI